MCRCYVAGEHSPPLAPAPDPRSGQERVGSALPKSLPISGARSLKKNSLPAFSGAFCLFCIFFVVMFEMIFFFKETNNFWVEQLNDQV